MTCPPFDQECSAALARVYQALPDAYPVTPETIADFRVRIDEATDAEFAALAPNIEKIEERNVPSDYGDEEVPILVLEPVVTQTPSPCIYWIHGGGMIAGSSRSQLAEPISWAREHRGTVVSVDYRLAPEFPYPGGLTDCLAGLAWVADHASDLGVDEDRILISGSSAGGGLAAAAALVLRDRGGIRLMGQILISPMLDDRELTMSSVMLEGRGGWDRISNRTGWTALLGSTVGTSDVPPYAAPARATSLENLPPTYIDSGSAEIFRDEITDYANRIWHAGGDAELHVWAGGCHGFQKLAPSSRLSKEAVVARQNWVRRRLNDGI